MIAANLGRKFCRTERNDLRTKPAATRWVQEKMPPCIVKTLAAKREIFFCAPPADARLRSIIKEEAERRLGKKIWLVFNLPPKKRQSSYLFLHVEISSRRPLHSMRMHFFDLKRVTG